MSLADAVWLRGDSVANKVVISAVLWFDAPLDVAALRRRIEERLLTRHPVFAQRVIASRVPGRMPTREPDPDFDLAHHLRIEPLPEPGDHATLERRCSEERSTPLDPDHSLWAATLHTGYRGVGCALHVRIHHSMGDGLALMQLLLTLADEFDPALVPLVDDEHHLAEDLRHLAGRSAATAIDLARHPTRATTLVGDAVDTLRWSTRLLLPTYAPSSLLHGRPEGRKRMVWTPDGLAVSDLLDASHARGVTANDLLLAILAGGIRRYLGERDAIVDEVLVMVPVNLRQLGEPLPRQVGNRIGLLPVLLPVGRADHEERVRLIRERTAALKGSRAPTLSRALLMGTTLLTPGVERAIHRANQRWGTGVVTNVIGPDLVLHVVGARLAGVIGWGGMTGPLNLGGSFISLGGRLYTGIVTDEAITPDPRRLLEHVHEEWRDVLPSATPVAAG
jgi:diacylglycerol O-acyltransferase / wax synthase